MFEIFVLLVKIKKTVTRTEALLWLFSGDGATS